MGRATSGRSVATSHESEVTAEDFAGGLSNAFLQCRELGHVWRPWTVDYNRQERSFFRQLRCSSCKTIRKQLLNHHGHVISNSYDYSDGYLSRHLQPGTYSRDVFRVEALTRWVEKHSQQVGEHVVKAVAS